MRERLELVRKEGIVCSTADGQRLPAQYVATNTDAEAVVTATKVEVGDCTQQWMLTLLW